MQPPISGEAVNLPPVHIYSYQHDWRLIEAKAQRYRCACGAEALRHGETYFVVKEAFGKAVKQ